MKPLLQSVMVAAALVFVAAGPIARPAQAATIDLGVIDVGSTIDFGNSLPDAGSFNDTFTFTLESSATISIDAASDLFVPLGTLLIGIENLSLEFFQVDPLPVQFIAGFDVSGAGGGGSLTNLMLDAGTYFFHVSGVSVGEPGAILPAFTVPSGIYAGEIAAVPLPTAAVLFLSALACIIGLPQVRRRWSPRGSRA